MRKKKRLIDANKLADTIFLIDSYSADAVRQQIREAPAVDAEEVVRCKDCVICTKEDGTPWCGFVCMRVADDDFCSWGRKNETD